MPRSLADGRTKLALLSTKPAVPNAATLTELNAGVAASCRILASDFKLGPTASDTVDEPDLCQEGKAPVPTQSNYEGSITAFRYFDATGKAETGTLPAEIGDLVYQTLKTKGTKLWIAKRFTSKKATDPWAAEDEYELYEVTTDNPVDGERTGYIKKVVPLFVQDAWLDGKVAAGT